MSNPEVEKLMLSIPGRLTSETLAGLDGTVQFDLDFEGNDKWFLTVCDGKAEIQRGTFPTPAATFMAGSDDFISLLTGDIENIGYSFMQGKIVFEGSINILWRVLSQLREQ